MLNLGGVVGNCSSDKQLKSHRLKLEYPTRIVASASSPLVCSSALFDTHSAVSQWYMHPLYNTFLRNNSSSFSLTFLIFQNIEERKTIGSLLLSVIIEQSLLLVAHTKFENGLVINLYTLDHERFYSYFKTS